MAEFHWISLRLDSPSNYHLPPDMDQEACKICNDALFNMSRLFFLGKSRTLQCFQRQMLPGIALRTEVAECKGGERRMVVAFFVCFFSFPFFSLQNRLLFNQNIPDS